MIVNAAIQTAEFATFPNRGTSQGDLMAGLRTWNIEGETILAYAVDDLASTVTFAGITYGGQDWAEILAMLFARIEHLGPVAID